MQQVEINVEDDGDLRLRANLGDGRQDLGWRGAALQSALCGQLVDDAVGQRIAERDPQFQNVDPGRIEAQSQSTSGLQIRITSSDIDH